MKHLRLALFCALLLAPLAVCWAALHTLTIDQAGHERQAFGTTIFGIGRQTEEAGIWPCNFWSNFDRTAFADDLAVLKLEGGNAAIILYPYIDEVEAPARLQLLKSVLELAEAQGIKITLRLGYAWDNGYSNTAKQRQVGLLVEPKLREGWYRFCAQTHALAMQYRSFAGAFICWEDYWAFLAGAGMDEAGRKAWARYIHYPRDTIPARTEPQMEEYFDYFNQVFAQDFFPATQRHFPGLGMEVRLDYDPIYDQGKFLKYYIHKQQFSAPNLRQVYLYWGPFMGALNEGDAITADLALRLLVIALERAQALSSPEASVIISQFNYRDNTPGFSHNSRIMPEQMDEFIRRSAPILRQYCTGVFTWSNHSYRHNAINNGTFSTGPAFWNFTRALAGHDRDRTSVSVFPGGSLVQQIEPNTAICAGLIDSESARLEFSAKSVTGVTGVVSLGGQEQTVTLKDGGQWHRYTVDFAKPQVAGQTIGLTFPQGAQVDDVVLANHTQVMGPQDPNFTRDVSYADLARAMTREPEPITEPTILSGVTPDNWIMSRATIAAPAKDGRYQITLKLTVPEFIRDQTVYVSMQGSPAPASRLALQPGEHELVLSGHSTTSSVVLTLAFARRQIPSATSPDQRELAVYVGSVGP